jgi:hypothetical protein
VLFSERHTTSLVSVFDVWCAPALQPKGSSFNDDTKEYYRFQLGARSVIPAWEEAVAGMKVQFAPTLGTLCIQDVEKWFI